MKITIGGLPGSGKTSLGKNLSKKYKIPFLTAGGLRRNIAKDLGMKIHELNKLGEKHPWTDKVIDSFQKQLGKINTSFVFEGRLSWFFIPDSIKILLMVTKKEGAKRIFNKQRDSENKFKTEKEVIKYNDKRQKSDAKRYSKIYGIKDYYSTKNYDIIIDTTNLTKKQTFKKALKEIRKEKIRRILKLK
jgi:cytidylate kinase